MKPIDDIMDRDAKNIPFNLIHMFQVSTRDFGLDDEEHL